MREASVVPTAPANCWRVLNIALASARWSSGNCFCPLVMILPKATPSPVMKIM